MKNNAFVERILSDRKKVETFLRLGTIGVVMFAFLSVLVVILSVVNEDVKARMEIATAAGSKVINNENAGAVMNFRNLAASRSENGDLNTVSSSARTGLETKPSADLASKISPTKMSSATVTGVKSLWPVVERTKMVSTNRTLAMLWRITTTAKSTVAAAKAATSTTTITTTTTTTIGQVFFWCTLHLEILPKFL